MNREQLMTVKDLMEYLQVSQRAIYYYRDKGLPYIKFGKSVRYDKEQVDKWLMDQNKEEK